MPTKKVNDKTPLTFGELTPDEVKRAQTGEAEHRKGQGLQVCRTNLSQNHYGHYCQMTHIGVSYLVCATCG